MILSLDFEPDLHRHLEFVHGPVHDSAALLHNLEPIHVTDSFRSLGNARFDRFRKAYGRGSNQFDNLVGSSHVPQYTRTCGTQSVSARRGPSRATIPTWARIYMNPKSFG